MKTNWLSPSTAKMSVLVKWRYSDSFTRLRLSRRVRITCTRLVNIWTRSGNTQLCVCEITCVCIKIKLYYLRMKTLSVACITKCMCLTEQLLHYITCDLYNPQINSICELNPFMTTSLPWIFYNSFSLYHSPDY